ncbi:MAG: hypothetical protein ACOC0O_07780 [Spirochaetota bacterium]
MKRITLSLAVVLAVLALAGCSDASVASQNLSRAADQFEIYRRVVFYNGITDEYMLVVEGYSSINVDTEDNQLELTVRTGDGQFLKHYLGLSDNVTYFAEQLDVADVDTARYRVVFKPSAIVPAVDIE